MSKKFGVPCDIYTYVLQVDPDFAEYLRGTCTEDALRPGRRSAGTTLLLPDKANPVRKELDKLATSDNPDDMRKAADIILAMIVRDYITTPSGWDRKDGDIPNSMYPSRKIVTKKVDGMSVHLEGSGGDAVIKKDAGFKDGSRKRNLAVWTLSGAGVSTSTPEAARPVIAKKPGAKKHGAYQPSDEETARLRFQIGVLVENAAAQDGMAGKHGTLLHYALGLVHYLKSTSADFYNDYFPLVSCSPADFYIFLEPHSPAGHSDFLVPTELIEQWWEHGPHKFDDLHAFCEEICGGMPHDGWFSPAAREALLRAIDDQREVLMNAPPSQAANALVSCAASGMIGRHAMFPEGRARAYYHANAQAKLVHDELRYSIIHQCKALAGKSGVEFVQEFHQIIQWIAQLMHTQKPAILKDTHKELAKMFINSVCFMYIYMTKSEREGLSKCTADLSIAQTKEYLFDAIGFGEKLFARLAPGNALSQLAAIVGNKKLSPEQVRQIQDLVKQPL